jgi:signal transduction histidine kinase
MNERMLKYFRKKNYITVISGIIIFAGLYVISLYSYLLYHSIAELFSIIIAFGIFIIAWNSRKFIGNNYLLFLGIAYLFVALIDLMHTLAYQGMNIFINFPGPNLATQLWISARYVESISILIALFFLNKRLDYKIQFAAYSFITALILLSIFYLRIFPASFIEGAGLTPFKVISEYIISALLIATIFLLSVRRKEFEKSVFILITASISLTILSELFFTLYTDVYGLFNQIGHFLKILSFYLIYKAIIEKGFSQPFDLLFFKLKQNESKYRALFENIAQPFALCEVLFDNNNTPIDYIFLEVNDRWAELLSMPKEKIIGSRAYKLLPELEPYWLSVFSEVAATGNPKKIERFDKLTRRWLEILLFSPQKGQIAVLAEDITEAKKIEKLKRKIENQRVERLQNKKLAEELHDTVSQTLFASNILSESIERSWQKSPKKSLDNIKKIKDLNESALKEMRRIIYDLMPQKIKGTNLDELIKNFLKNLKRNDIKARIETKGKGKYSSIITYQAYRIAQEAINNIIKHSKADRMNIDISQDPKKLQVLISDNGIGFNTGDRSSKKNFGLNIMRDRAKTINASLTIKSVSGKGTTVLLEKIFK